MCGPDRYGDRSRTASDINATALSSASRAPRGVRDQPFNLGCDESQPGEHPFTECRADGAHPGSDSPSGVFRPHVGDTFYPLALYDVQQILRRIAWIRRSETRGV